MNKLILRAVLGTGKIEQKAQRFPPHTLPPTPTAPSQSPLLAAVHVPTSTRHYFTAHLFFLKSDKGDRQASLPSDLIQHRSLSSPHTEVLGLLRNLPSCKVAEQRQNRITSFERCKH